jgi:hypothetical protein
MELMRTSTPRTEILAVGLLLLLALAIACGGGESVESEVAAEPTDQPAEPQAAAAEMTLVEMLAAADLVDGTADHVVSRCAACNLGMQGSADHAVQIGEYELHFCSEGCAKPFAESPEQAVMAMVLPEAPAPPEQAEPQPEG